MAKSIVSSQEQKQGRNHRQEQKQVRHFTYVVECADGTLYTGYTTDVEKRVAAHNAGRGAKYTKPRLPVRLAYQEEHPTKVEAMRREFQIKRMPRAAKLKLIQKL